MEAIQMYRNPDAPVGYAFQEKTKTRTLVVNNNFLFLLKELEGITIESELETYSDHFRRNLSSEESSDEDVQVDDKNDAVGTSKSSIEEEALDKSCSVASSSRTVSPIRSVLPKKRVPKSDRSPKKSKTSGGKKDSDSDSDSSRYSKPRSRRRSPSPSPVRIKQEVVPEHLFGCYHCDVCNLTLNSKATYDSHVIGKRHKKACNKALNIVDTVARSVPATEVECKKPMPAPGIVRIKVKTKAHIQDYVEKIQNPLPGLHYVTEIRGFSETSYYCSLCNAPCSGNSIIPHLGGFKHMLKSLKMYRPDVYEQISYKQKYQIEDRVKKILMSVEEREGRGRVTVEEEKLSVDSTTGEEFYGPTPIEPVQSTSRQADYMDFEEYYDQTTIPDTSKSGYYCRLCEAHMNSYDMWQNHIGGKRHTTNARKLPGSIPSKIKNIPMKDVRAKLLNLLEDIDTPVVGLDHIRETQNRQTRKDMYQCYLCGACLNTNDIVDHVISHKHRVKYLQEVRDDCLDVVKDMDINGPNAIAIVEDACARIEEKSGPGKPIVFFSKDFFPPLVV